MPFPVPTQVAHQVEGGPIHPMQVIEQQHQRPSLRQGIHQSRHRFKEPHLGRQFILRGGRKVGVAHPQLW